MSEARKATPSCSPRTSGVLRRAATMVSGSSAETTAMENEPRSRGSTVRVASARVGPAGHLLLDQVGQHLGVGGGDQRVPAGLELGLQLGVVLDDAVVDEGQPAAAVDVRVGVLRRSGRRGWPSGCARWRRRARWARPPSARPSLATEFVPPAARARQTVSAPSAPSTTMATPAES